MGYSLGYSGGYAPVSDGGGSSVDTPFIPVTCDDANVLFDVLNYEADDHDETWFVFEIFASTVGA